MSRSKRWPATALARFNQVYPDVKITYEPQPSDYGTKLLAQIKSNSQPDVFYLDVDLPYQLIPNNVLLDLTPALTEVGRSKDDYFPSLTGVFLGKDGARSTACPRTSPAWPSSTTPTWSRPRPKPAGPRTTSPPGSKRTLTGSGQTQVFGFASDLVFFPYWGNFALANGATGHRQRQVCHQQSRGSLDP